MQRTQWTQLAFLLLGFVPQLGYSQTPLRAELVSRPPQFVMLAFDGSLNLDFWRESRGVAQNLKSQGKPLHFTYFMSGVYFLGGAHRNEYDAPVHGRGKSAIGFGGDVRSLPYRVEQANMALEEGHEMGSHANGHFDAGSEKWTENDWKSEFAQFNHLIFDLFAINQVRPIRPQGWILKKEDVIGFRAPQLGVTEGLWPTLVSSGFRYDTSKTSEPTYWPQKGTDGLWNFPLARLTIVGTARRTLSMDYNFYFTQSNGQEDPAHKELYKTQMLDTYRKYFQDNYNGNRAPIHIGHHFSKWNGGAYWEAMQQFASEVCGMPEVKCVTYREYMSWLESQKPEDLAAYRRGLFPKPQPVHLTLEAPLHNIELELTADALNDKVLARVRGNVDPKLGLSPRIFVDGEAMGRSELDLGTIRDLTDAGDNSRIMAALVDRQGKIVASSTRLLKRVGTPSERLATEILENRALQGDLPEAHREEGEGSWGL